MVPGVHEASYGLPSLSSLFLVCHRCGISVGQIVCRTSEILNELLPWTVTGLG